MSASAPTSSPTKRSRPESASTRLESHRAFGKLILFGEHFVVYKQPAFVAAVGNYTDCSVQFSEAEWSHGLIVEDNRPATPGYKVKKADEMLHATKLVLDHLKVDTSKRALKITLGGNLCCVSGIGASAANCVSIARAINTALDLKLSEEEINAAGYEGERGYHGTPSGIDNTASTYGGVLKFCRTDAEPIFKTQKLKSPGLIVYGSTGITASTTTVVGDVRKHKESDPAWYAALAAKYQSIFDRAAKALNVADWATIGALANENHALLQELGVSCKELDTLVAAAKSAGATGAKMSGTGRGGLMWSLCPDVATQEKVYAALQKICPEGQVWKTTFQ